jgi:hypothetical protein
LGREVFIVSGLLSFTSYYRPKVFKDELVENNMKRIIALGIVALIVVLAVSLVSAVTIESVFADDLVPGQEGQIRIEVENTLQNDVKDVSIRLDFTGLPFRPVGSSEENIDELDEDEDEEFVFRIKAANDIKPGDYQIPYTLEFIDEDKNKERKGSIGVSVKANSELIFSISQENQIVNKEGTITFKIVNKGFGDAKFLTVKIIPESYTLLSDSDVYIGTVDSDDFETATFDVFYKEKNPLFIASVQYKDFDNKNIVKTVNLPIVVYSEDEAVELGIIKKNNVPVYIGVVVTLILIWIFYRVMRKYLRNKRRVKSGG